MRLLAILMAPVLQVVVETRVPREASTRGQTHSVMMMATHRELMMVVAGAAP